MCLIPIQLFEEINKLINGIFFFSSTFCFIVQSIIGVENECYKIIEWLGSYTNHVKVNITTGFLSKSSICGRGGSKVD